MTANVKDIRPLVNKKSSAFLRDLTRQASELSVAESDSLERDISKITDAFNFICAKVEMPPQCRAYLDALIGAAHAKLKPGQPIDDWFEASDVELGRRALPNRADELGTASLRKWTQRHRKAFFDWESKSLHKLVRCEPGGQDDNGDYQLSRYSLPILIAAAELLREASIHPLIRSNPDKALESSMAIALASLPNAPEKLERFRRPRKDDSAMLRRNESTISSLFQKDLQILAVKARFNPTNAIKSFEDHYDQIINKLQAAKDEAVAIAQKGMDTVAMDTVHPCPPIHTINIDKCGQSPRTQGGGLALVPARIVKEPAMERTEQALADVACFESVGATAFYVSIMSEELLDGSPKKKIKVYPDISARELREMLPAKLAECEREHWNFIIRPRVDAADRLLVGLDDLSKEKLQQVETFAFRVVETSPGNYQAWLCILNADDIKRRFKEGIGADLGMSEATRIAGSINFKEKYAVKEGRKNYKLIGDYPRVTGCGGIAGRLVTQKEVGHLLAPVEQPPCVQSPVRAAIGERKRELPDYGQYVSNARLNGSGRIDRSAIDAAWAATALKRGYLPGEVKHELAKVSLKAKAMRGRAKESYIKKTVDDAVRRASF